MSFARKRNFFFGQLALFSFLKKKGQGQASIELILLLVVILLLVQTIIIPSREVAKKSAEDVSSMAIVRSQAQKLANAIELVDSSASGAKQTIHLMIPQHSKIGCNDSTIIPTPTPTNPLGIYYQTWPDAKIGIPEACLHDIDIPTDPDGANRCTGGINISLSSTASLDCSDVLRSGSNVGTITDRSASDSAVFVKVTVSKVGGQVSLSVE